ncbi:MAG: NAD(P)H-hydrate dehydratase [Pyrinomonadaceae bacterium]|nr:NAD(P)H-hydrate dehydratase [Pyrinomonadaceae bacterium]
MQKVLTAEEMREVDRLTTEKYGIPSLLLMENAAHSAARVITEKLGGSVKGKIVLVLCGKGNNGGDGAALARILWMSGAEVAVSLIGKIEDTKGDAKINFEIMHSLSMRQPPEIVEIGTNGNLKINQNWKNWNELIFQEIITLDEWKNFEKTNFHREDPEIIIDALFGTGLTRRLADIYEEIATYIRCFNFESVERDTLVVSLDIPSGLDADKSEKIGVNPEAHLTVTFTAPKLSNVFPPASNFNGELVVANIGSPQELIDNCQSKLFVTEKEDAQNWLELTKIQTDSYKKTRGRALIIAGSENYSGAAVLSANACFSAGAGMVTVAVPKEIRPIVSGKVSGELIVQIIEKIDVQCDVIGMGCGMSPDEKMHEFIRETVLNRKTPMVLDAQALNAFSPCSERFSEEFPLVLTPHLGEFTRLLGREVSEDRIAEVREFAQKHNVILVLKGERSLIGKPDGTVVINPTGNAGISRAGAGDTLTGIITSFLAQTFAVKNVNIENAFEATIAALYIAGVAGDIAAEKFSQRLMTATDVRECLQEAIASLRDEG